MRVTRSAPVYERIKTELREKIESGVFRAGDRVPTEMELAASYSVSRGQTRQALRELALEGYLVRTPGRGSFVSTSPPKAGRGAHNLRTVTVALPRSTMQYNQSVIQGILEGAAESHLHTTFYYLRMQPESELEFLREIRSSGAMGLLFWPCFRTPEEADLIAELARSGFPCVLVDRYLPEIGLDSVGTDNRTAYRQLTETLIEEGHRRIAFAFRDFDDSVMEDRFAGHVDAMSRAGLRIDAMAIRAGHPTSDDGQVEERLNRLFPEGGLPSAVCCTDDVTAQLVRDCLVAKGLSVPGDVAIATTLDADPPGREPSFPVLTIRQQGHLIGTTAARLLDHRLRNPGGATERRLVPAVLEDVRSGRER